MKPRIYIETSVISYPTSRPSADGIVLARQQRTHELWTFGWWFASDIFDDDWALEHLAAVLKLTGRVEVDHLVAKRLEKTVEGKPKLTTECLSGMVEGVKEIYEILGWDKEARAILTAALKSGNGDAKATATALIPNSERDLSMRLVTCEAFGPPS